MFEQDPKQEPATLPSREDVADVASTERDVQQPQHDTSSGGVGQ